MAAGGLNATEMNVECSAVKWNPVSIVALALCKDMCITCALLCGRKSVPCLEANRRAMNEV